MQKENTQNIEYYLGLGSSMGDRRANLQKAVSFLEKAGRVLKVSAIYETEPVDMEPAAERFYNQVLCLVCRLTPLQLLSRIKEYEKSMGRDIRNSHKKPRIIDIDILLAGDSIINREELVIPHREMHKRAFVLVPLVEIAPGLVHPVLKKSVGEMLAKVDVRGIKKI
jgi:2-amino-4-hydroxy-6-hydroxymethyldihydropteridine diphosphokinase